MVMSEPITLESSLKSRANASVAFRRMYDAEASAGAESTLWRTMADTIKGAMFRYTKSVNDIKLFEWDCHDIWYQYIQLAKNIEAQHPAQDRLIRVVLWTRELGVLSRTKKRSQLWPVTEPDNHEIVIQEAVTEDGRLWVDLPYLVSDIRSAWAEVMSHTTSPSHRYNLASAIARLAGLGIQDNALSGCGLAVMREGLEVPRVIYHESSPTGQALEDSAGSMTRMSIMDFHPMLMSWLTYAGHKLLRLSHTSYDAASWDTTPQTHPGELAISAGVESAGFSRARFGFWINRMEKLKQNDRKEVREAFQKCYNLTRSVLQELDDHGLEEV
ncbi:hypothetical protein BJ170DRAFT_637490 [Xylariales sp. AK1849]|nr:hypothetical protein BJ170DRAFT_637490 [Xylariales sp. AK1849]